VWHCPKCSVNVYTESCWKCGSSEGEVADQPIGTVTAKPQPSKSKKTGYRVCAICKQEVAETDGYERNHYSAVAYLLDGVVHPMKVFVCHTCGAQAFTPAFKIFMLIIFALVCGCGLLAMLAPPAKKR
jgi:hypothetical protein